MSLALSIHAFILVLVHARPDCDTWTECETCTIADSFVPGSKCTWCPIDGQCHGFLSPVNPCPLPVVIDKPSHCNASQPTPTPQPQPDTNATAFVRETLEELFKKLGITDVDVSVCAKDFAGASHSFRNFAGDTRSKLFSNAVIHLSRGLSALSRATSDCNVVGVQQKIDTLAASVRWANISKHMFDSGAKIIVSASDLWKDVEALASAVESNDPSSFGQKLGVLLGDWSALHTGCDDNHACKLLDGLLRVLQVTASDVRPCLKTLAPAVADFTAAADAFKQKYYNATIAKLAVGFDVLAAAATQDACQLQTVADAVGGLSARLKSAVVKIEGSGAIKITIGSADVYQEIRNLFADLGRGDYAGVGLQLGALLSELRASSCESKACIMIEGLLGTLQVGFADFTACSSDIDRTWDKVMLFMRSVKNGGNHMDTLRKLGDLLGAFSTSVQHCGIQQVGPILTDTANHLHHDALATNIGKIVQWLANGADISADLQRFITDFDTRQWANLGRDLGGLSDWISSSTACHSFVCQLVEGVLQEADITLSNLQPCAAELRKAEKSFTTGAALWGKGATVDAIKSWALGLNEIAQGVHDCGLSQQLGYIEQEANVLGLGNFTVLSGVEQLLVHGSDFYEVLYGALQDIQHGDYRSAGGKMATVMNDLSKWTTGHLCTSPICYFVNGALQYLTDLQTELKSCRSDFKNAWDYFKDAYKNLNGRDSPFAGFQNNTHNVIKGINDIGKGIQSVVSGLKDCHVADLTSILEKLGEQLVHAPPQLQWIENFLKILVQGVEIETQVADACIDFGRDDWPGFGYNIAKLTKTLAVSKAASVYTTKVEEVYV